MPTLSAYEGLGFPLPVGSHAPHNRHREYPPDRTTQISKTPALEQPLRSSSQLGHFKKILQHSNATAGNDVHSHPTTVPDVPGSTPAALPEVADGESLRTYLKEHKAAVIDGVIVRDIHLLVGDVSSEDGKSRVQSRNLPVLPFQVPESNGVRTQLKSSQLDPSAMPVLVFPEEYIAPPGFEKVETLLVPGTSIIIEKAGLQFFMALKKEKTSDPSSTSESSLVTRNGGEASISILGIVKYESVIFKSSLYLTRMKNEKERDWLVFGSADRVRLREIWPLIAEDSFLNLQLDNVAVIASSRDRNMPSRKHQSGQTRGTDGIHNGGREHASWDVLSEIETHGYSVTKGTS